MYLVIASLLGASPIPPVLGPAWAEFSRAPQGRLTATKIEVGTLGMDQARQQLHFWLRRTVTSGARQQEEVTWADTPTCSAARPVLASMRDIPVPRFAPIGSSEGPPIMLDGALYALRTYSDHGTLAAQTNVNTPLAEWVEATIRALDGCWSSRVPERVR